jgi:hypothetical protein
VSYPFIKVGFGEGIAPSMTNLGRLSCSVIAAGPNPSKRAEKGQIDGLADAEIRRAKRVPTQGAKTRARRGVKPAKWRAKLVALRQGGFLPRGAV